MSIAHSTNRDGAESMTMVMRREISISRRIRPSSITCSKPCYRTFDRGTPLYYSSPFDLFASGTKQESGGEGGIRIYSQIRSLIMFRNTELLIR